VSTSTGGAPLSDGGTSNGGGAQNATAGEAQSGASSHSATRDASGCNCGVVGSTPLPVGVQYSLLALLTLPTARRFRRRR